MSKKSVLSFLLSIVVFNIAFFSLININAKAYTEDIIVNIPNNGKLTVSGGNHTIENYKVTEYRGENNLCNDLSNYKYLNTSTTKLRRNLSNISTNTIIKVFQLNLN